MIVVDASAMVEALVGSDLDPNVLNLLNDELAAPHLLDVEVLSVLRGLERGGKLAAAAGAQARNDFFAFSIGRHEIGPLAERIWALRHQFTTYDAAYLALAEGLEVPLVTCDRKLAVGGHQATVVVATAYP